MIRWKLGRARPTNTRMPRRSTRTCTTHLTHTRNAPLRVADEPYVAAGTNVDCCFTWSCLVLGVILLVLSVAMMSKQYTTSVGLAMLGGTMMLIGICAGIKRRQMYKRREEFRARLGSQIAPSGVGTQMVGNVELDETLAWMIANSMNRLYPAGSNNMVVDAGAYTVGQIYTGNPQNPYSGHAGISNIAFTTGSGDMQGPPSYTPSAAVYSPAPPPPYHPENLESDLPPSYDEVTKTPSPLQTLPLTDVPSLPVAERLNNDAGITNYGVV